ncbi:MAG TPA: tannase/feruloyl esterase family alpha/beta hydrolase [Edaphobacter sp.]|jgi:feruloyl esterase|nr:tannase/feruloyl esterase family alpha/beta hydrolase [Edaphobacter sp.]
MFKLRSWRRREVLGVACAFFLFGWRAYAESCEKLAGLKLPDTTITVAKIETRETARTLENGTPGAPLMKLPEFCRVAGTISPVKDSLIGFEVWMPVTGWNHRLMAVGNGGFSGAPWVRFMGGALRNGYATAGTDTGHKGEVGDASFALGHPEKVVDFGYRSVHQTTLKAKAIIEAFYGALATKAYWDGCSSGGKEGLMEAQRYPADYDGIIAGAPANNWERLSASGVWIGQATHATAASYLPHDKLVILHEAALNACGARDGVIGDPFGCHFDPAAVLCKGKETASCLSREQVDAARKIYAGPVNPRTHEKIFPGLEPGSELGWGSFGEPPEPPITASHFKYIVFQDPKWDYRSFNFDSDLARGEKVDGGTLTANDPDLRPFFERGGKLILYHGLSDSLIAPRNTIAYYNDVVKTTGALAADSMRLYLIAGMNHCFGGAGLTDFDMEIPLVGWVEDGKMPTAVPAAHFPDGPPLRPDRTGALCPYPEVAKYKGTGGTNDATSDLCAKP